MDNKIAIAIFASGNGSNAENIIHFAAENPQLFVACVITDQPAAGVVQRCERLQTLCYTVPRQHGREDQEQRILTLLAKHRIDWICLAGYMRILSAAILAKFYDPLLEVARVINIHPSLLPAFPGKNAYERAFSAGVEQSGATVHFVDEGVDTGPVILQESFPRYVTDTFEQFKNRGLELEYRLYRSALKLIAEQRIAFKIPPDTDHKTDHKTEQVRGN